MPNGLSKWNAGPYPWYINVRQQFYLLLQRIESHATFGTAKQLPVITEISIHSSTLLLCAMVTSTLQSSSWSSYLINMQCIYLKKRGTYITIVIQYAHTQLIDEREQVKQLSKNSINWLWSVSIITNLKAHNNTYCLANSIASLDMPNNS